MFNLFCSCNCIIATEVKTLEIEFIEKIVLAYTGIENEREAIPSASDNIILFSFRTTS